MSIELYYFTSDGRRTRPNPYTPTSFSLDNSVVSALTKEHEWRSSPSVMDLRRYLQRKEKGTLALYIIPAILEEKLLRTDEPFETMFEHYCSKLQQLLGPLEIRPTYKSFIEFSARVVARFLGLSVVIAAAHRIYQETLGETEADKIRRRLWRISEWEEHNGHTGISGAAGLAIYSALATNTDARKALGISGTLNFDKLANGAWDMLQWDVAMNCDMLAILPKPRFFTPVSVFVTADRRLSNIFDSFSNEGYGGAIAVMPKGLLTELPVSYHLRAMRGQPPVLLENYPEFYKNAIVQLEAQMDVLKELSPAAISLHARCVQLHEYCCSDGCSLPKHGDAIPLAL